MERGQMSTEHTPESAGSPASTDIERIHYIVELSTPWVWEGTFGTTRQGNRNMGVDVIADNLIQAAQTALARFPEATLHVVRKVGASTRLLVAER